MKCSWFLWNSLTFREQRRATDKSVPLVAVMNFGINYFQICDAHASRQSRRGEHQSAPPAFAQTISSHWRLREKVSSDDATHNKQIQHTPTLVASLPHKQHDASITPHRRIDENHLSSVTLHHYPRSASNCR